MKLILEDKEEAVDAEAEVDAKEEAAIMAEEGFGPTIKYIPT